MPRKALVFVLACLTALAPLKFTETLALDHLVHWPRGLEWLTHIWPSSLFFVCNAFLVIAALWLLRDEIQLKGNVMLAVAFFLLIQGLSAAMSIDRSISWLFFQWFFSLAAAFCLGSWLVKNSSDLESLLFAWLTASVIVVWSGWNQAMGGLEEVRKLLATQPQLSREHPLVDDWARIDRIYATFMTPNALAGYLVATLGVIPVWLHLNEASDSSAKKSWFARGFLTLLALACLYCFWRTQSKSGFLILLFTAVFAQAMLAPSWRRALAGGLLLLLLSAALFRLGYMRVTRDEPVSPSILAKLDIAPYRRKDATKSGLESLSSRIEFWRAAAAIAADHPLLGSGPGTFAELYPRYKRPGALDTRLVHNNYLQLAAESGLLGLFSFLAWISLALQVVWKKARAAEEGQRRMIVLLGCACVSFLLQGLADYNLYTPGLAWPTFVLMGILAGQNETSQLTRSV